MKIMGQKVHPLGLRVGITKKHQSQWFARFNKYKYSRSVLEDRMLRQTLTSLFPQLLNPVLKKAQKRDDEGAKQQNGQPRITQILISRGLIPYEIGIQIHAENCELLQSSIENLKVQRDLVCKLQKTRVLLRNLREKLVTNNTNLLEDSVNTTENNASVSENTKQTVSTKKTKKTSRNGNKQLGRRNSFRRTRLSKQQLRRQRLIKKRLKRREIIKRKYNALMAKGLVLQKKGNNLLCVAKLKTKNKKKSFGAKKFSKKGKVRTNVSLKTSKKVTSAGLKATTSSRKNLLSKFLLRTNLLQSRINKKFVNVYVSKLNQKFLTTLKSSLKYWNSVALAKPNFAPLGTNKKWSLSNLKNLKNKPVSKLNKLVAVLEQKLVVHSTAKLKKQFLAFGSIKKIESFGYYQLVMFLKNLKELINRMKRKQKLQFAIKNLFTNKANNSKTTQKSSTLKLSTINFEENQNNLLNTTSFSSKNLQNKIKFIEYLKEIVKKHRQTNIYYYLSTISDARKDLRKLKQFTKKHASFLFGLNLESLEKSFFEKKLVTKVQDRVSRILEASANKTLREKTLQDIFLDQIEKQRTIYKENEQLTPKISIKFYSVKEKSLKAKASVVSDTIVDALEKRKAFRKVIKDSKEELMRTSGVKGVKIQVSGRLNGAEIARSEWVRAGRVPLQTLRANLDYSYKTANTIYGIIGVKVWIFKGYAKLIN